MLKRKLQRHGERDGKKWKIPPLIGWREWVTLPTLGVPWIKAKIDTGARTSVLHAYELEAFNQDGEEWVHFVVHPYQRDLKTTLHAAAPVVEWRRIRSSNGKVERRPVIRTEIAFMGKVWPIEITLTNRDEMGFRMLIGRQAILKRFAVHPGRSFYGGRIPADLAHHSIPP